MCQVVIQVTMDGISLKNWRLSLCKQDYSICLLYQLPLYASLRYIFELSLILIYERFQPFQMSDVDDYYFNFLV